MKKLMLLMLGTAILTIAAVAQKAPAKPTEKTQQTGLSQGLNEKSTALLDATLLGINQITSGVYVQASSTTSSQTYYLTIPAMSTASISLPPGNYNVSVSTSNILCDIYLTNQSSYVAYDKYFYTFQNINVTSSYTTAVAVYSSN